MIYLVVTANGQQFHCKTEMKVKRLKRMLNIFLYIRKELLDRYLMNEESELVWIIWGERQYAISTMANLAPTYKPGEKKPWEVFQSVITYKR